MSPFLFLYMQKLLIAFISLGIAITIPFYYEECLFFSVGELSLSWVFSSILIRVVIILFTIIAVHSIFRVFKPKFKFIFSVLIALLPGFGISFITPIYKQDYGNTADEYQLKLLPEIDQNQQISKVQSHKIVAFFTTTCPHCQEASTRLGVNLDGGQKVPVIGVFPGQKNDTEKFLETYNGENFSKISLYNNHDSLFVAIADGIFPSIFLLNEENKTLKHWTGGSFNYHALDYIKSLEP